MDVHEDGVFKQERTVEIKSASARAGAGEGSFAGYSGIYSGCFTISDVSDAHLGGDKVDGDNLMHQMSSLSDASGLASAINGGCSQPNCFASAAFLCTPLGLDITCTLPTRPQGSLAFTYR
jgi:hypothetical protein